MKNTTTTMNINKVLMCPPTHFRIDYKINVWMDLENQADSNKTLAAYNRLKKVYRSLGIDVLEIEQEADLPDMVYTANYGFIFKNIFIKANFRNKERIREAELAEIYFRKLGYKILKIPEDIIFEGQGDLVQYEDRFYCGYGHRTKFETIQYLENIFGRIVMPIRLIDPRWYHLDTCFMPLPNNKVILVPGAFEPGTLQKISTEFDEIIEVTNQEDINEFACNSIICNGNFITNRMSDRLKRKLEKENLKIIEVSMKEFLKGGGSLRCLTLDIPAYTG